MQQTTGSRLNLPKTSESIAVTGQCVYFVDEESESRRHVDALANRGYEVMCFSQAQAALDAWQKRPADIAVVEIDLPDMSGTELANQLRDMAPIPILMLSTLHDQTMVARAIACGAINYLVKPIAPAQLVPQIQTALFRAGDVESQLKQQLGAYRNIGAELDALLEQFTFGIAVVDSAGNVLRRNSAVDRILGTGDVVRLSGRQFTANDDGDTLALRDFMRKLCNGRDRKTRRDYVLALGRTTSGRHLQIRGVPLGAACRNDNYSVANGSEERGAAIVLLIDPDERVPLPASILTSLYGLTATEGRLAEALLNGLTIEQFAINSNTSYNTVRSHLRSVFVKTRTNRQIDLVRLLMRLLSSVAWHG